MFSGRIELPLDEYNGMKNRIEELEKEVLEKKKEAEKINNDYLELQLILEDLAEASIIDRVFNWEKFFKKVKDNE